MTPMLQFTPKTQWQLDRESEYRAQRRAVRLTLLLLLVLAGAVWVLSRYDNFVALCTDILK